MDVGALLERYSHLHTERPPLMWDAEVTEEHFLPLLEALIGAAQSPGTPSGTLTLAGANIVVPPESFDPEHEESCAPVGEYAGITVCGPGAWTKDWTWRPRQAAPEALAEACRAALRDSGACFAYGRALGAESSVTVFLPRSEKSDRG